MATASGPGPTEPPSADPGSAAPAAAAAARAPADRAALRMAGIVGGLIVALLGGFGLGRAATQPATAPPVGASHVDVPGAPQHGHGGTAGVNGESVVGGVANGLAAVAVGYRIVPGATVLPPGAARPFTFRILDAAGATVTRFIDNHERKLHLIVLRRDVTGFQHLHPVMAPDGTWSIPLRLPAPGIWHAYADFIAADAAGRQTPVTLGVDLTAPGAYAPAPLPAPAAAVAVGGYRVALEGSARAGAIQPVRFRVTRGGDPAPLDRYLGAYGHLVVIRTSDLGYVHVHADVTMAADAVQFWLSPPSPGTYRAFLDFSTGGAVRTAPFTLNVT
ncbi:hypothetical protein GCM10010124_01710 [Pilimelia terevasa]|uniref:Secreted protein n=1 Tax=Pilimelia terevasa TaxID=53372 RepID=A0A8J3FE60_9ACTN|nr:hypothetical protein [Pilimelia terevasa]GGK12820.1 hypothetical protein GCM10010124_01710 [Pilimelia terevasa]